jgi:hypothetical protein
MPMQLTRDTAATLLRLAQKTQDPRWAAALVQKAADLKDELDDQPSSKRDMTCKAPDVRSGRLSWRLAFPVLAAPILQTIEPRVSRSHHRPDRDAAAAPECHPNRNTGTAARQGRGLQSFRRGGRLRA